MFVNSKYLGFQQEKGTQPLTWVTIFPWEPAFLPLPHPFLAVFLRRFYVEKSHMYILKGTSTAPSPTTPALRDRRTLKCRKAVVPILCHMTDSEKKWAHTWRPKVIFSFPVIVCLTFSHKFCYSNRACDLHWPALPTKTPLPFLDPKAGLNSHTTKISERPLA